MHTPVPWGPYGSPGQGFTPINGFVTLGSVHHTEPLGQMWGEKYHDSQANAEFVCRAVNCHEELLAAIQAALSVKALWAPTEASHKDHPEEGAALACMLFNFEQVVAKATGKI